MILLERYGSTNSTGSDTEPNKVGVCNLHQNRDMQFASPQVNANSVCNLHQNKDMKFAPH